MDEPAKLSVRPVPRDVGEVVRVTSSIVTKYPCHAVDDCRNLTSGERPVWRELIVADTINDSQRIGGEDSLIRCIGKNGLVERYFVKGDLISSPQM